MKHFSPLCGRGMLKWVALAAVIALPVPALRAAPADEATAAPPATQPTAAADRHDPGATIVLLLPFQVVGGRQAQPWIGQSIQQSLLTDLVMGGPIRVSSSSVAATDPNAAVDVGKNAGAKYVVFGQVHVNDRGEGAGAAVRITGQVLDTATGRPVGVLKSTGSIDDLFPVEDDLAEQARAQFGRIEYAMRRDADRGAESAVGAGETRPSIEPYGPVTMRAYGSPDWAAVNGSNIPAAASNRYYFGNPYNWFEIVPTPTYVYPNPGYGGYPYYGGGSVSYGFSGFPLGAVVNPGINNPGTGGITPTPRFVTEPPLHGVRLPTGPLVGPNPTPAAGPVPNQMGVTTPRSFPGHVFHGKTYGQTLGVEK